jgi:hypothetical protein
MVDELVRDVDGRQCLKGCEDCMLCLRTYTVESRPSIAMDQVSKRARSRPPAMRTYQYNSQGYEQAIGNFRKVNSREQNLETRFPLNFRRK